MIQKDKLSSTPITSKVSNWKSKAQFRKQNKWLTYSSQIARRIIAAIGDKKEMTQAKLAAALNVSPQQISKIVKGEENLTLETIFKLSQALEIDLISFPRYKYDEIILGKEMPTSNGTLTVKVNNISSFSIKDTSTKMEEMEPSKTFKFSVSQKSLQPKILYGQTN